MKLPKILLAGAAGLSLATFAYAQDAAGVLEHITGLSVQQQLYVTWGMAALKYLSELYSAVRNGGGLRRIVLSFWFGENLPKVVAQDYSKELSTPPFPVAKPDDSAKPNP